MRSSHLYIFFYTICAKRRNDKNIMILIHFSHSLGCPPHWASSPGNDYIDTTRRRCYDWYTPCKSVPTE